MQINPGAIANLKPIVTSTNSSSPNVYAKVNNTYSHLINVHVDFSADKPTGYSLFKVEMVLGWTNGHSQSAYLEELMGVTEKTYLDISDVTDVTFSLYTQLANTLGANYTTINNYRFIATWLPNDMMN